MRRLSGTASQSQVFSRFRRPYLFSCSEVGLRLRLDEVEVVEGVDEVDDVPETQGWHFAMRWRWKWWRNWWRAGQACRRDAAPSLDDIDIATKTGRNSWF